MRIWGVTHRGSVRKENQDAYHFIAPEAGPTLGVVCDGMGGAQGGKIASRLAIRTFTDAIRPHLSGGRDPDGWDGLLRKAAEAANAVVYQQALSDPRLHGMGTTIVAAVVEEDCAHVLNIGDSRAYHVSGKKITQITSDHSVVEDMVAHGEITRAEAQFHPQKNLITRALGVEETVEGDVFSVALSPGDHLLLCSDGVSNLLTEKELLTQVRRSDTPEDCCGQLMDRVFQRGASDNLTAVLFQI